MTDSFVNQASPPRPTLLGKLREELAVRHYARRTVKSYVLGVRRYLGFHGRRHPREMGAPEIHSFLSHLATDLGVSASTRNQALSALLFLYRHVLETGVGDLMGIPRARQRQRVPTVLTPHEVKDVLDRLAGAEGLVARLLYGSGLRLLEALRLRVKDLDFEKLQVTVRSGKGDKDRSDDAAAHPGGPPAAASDGRAPAPSAGPRGGLGESGVALCIGTEVPECGIRMGLAVGLPATRPLARSQGPQGRTPPPGPDSRTEGRAQSGVGSRDRQAGELPYPPTLLCYASAGKGTGHPHDPGTPRPQRCEDHNDLHAMY